MTMRVTLPTAFRYGVTGAPSDRATVNTIRDFGPVEDGVQERYLSYHGIKRAIKDEAKLEVHYIRDKIPFKIDEKTLNTSFEQLRTEMEVEDEQAKDLIQRQRSKLEGARATSRSGGHGARKDTGTFSQVSRSERPKAQLTVRPAHGPKMCWTINLSKRGLPQEWSDVIVSEAQKDEIGQRTAMASAATNFDCVRPPANRMRCAD